MLWLVYRGTVEHREAQAQVSHWLPCALLTLGGRDSHRGRNSDVAMRKLRHGILFKSLKQTIVVVKIWFRYGTVTLEVIHMLGSSFRNIYWRLEWNGSTNVLSKLRARWGLLSVKVICEVLILLLIFKKRKKKTFMTKYK